MKIFTKKMLSVCLSLLILGNTFISPFTFVNAETQNNNDSSTYNGKWMFHLPKDFGALAGTCAKIDGKWYYFDRNGYMAYESYDRPDFSKLADSYN